MGGIGLLSNRLTNLLSRLKTATVVLLLCGLIRFKQHKIGKLGRD